MGDVAARRGRWDDLHRHLHFAHGTYPPDQHGKIRTERVIVQAKHWRKRPVGPTDVADTLTKVKLWQPPVVRFLVIATSGHFSADAVAWAEQHNESGAAPLIELWPKSMLETLLAQKPHLVAAHGLR